jgi:hypothetical protein
MSEIYQVKDFAAALSLAKKFKSDGTYKLFRGQAKNWPVVSSLGRLLPNVDSEIEKKIKRLYYFFQTYPSLSKYHSDVDWFWAVAQHYGLPTNYIDFTTKPEVATYFATHSNKNIVGESAVIICVNEHDFSRLIDSFKTVFEKDKVIPPYIAKIDVDNLWRLQAQEGCFLFSPYNNIEFFYDFDRIIFPYTIPFDKLKVEDIYPERKSELEILLDQFFNTEGKLKAQKNFRKFIKESNLPVVRIEASDHSPLLKKNIVHSSWKSKIFRKWQFPLKEAYENTIEPILINVQLLSKKNIHFQIRNLIEQLIKCFYDHQINRNNQLKFNVILKPKLGKKMSRQINRSCCRIWDGMRNLPFKDLEIISVIAKYVCLELYEHKTHKTFSLSGEDLILLEILNEYGSITRCHASPSKIVASFRKNIKKILIDDLTTILHSEILLHVNNPKILFNFEKLIELFVDEIIAYQVLYNSDQENPVIFYTPSHISVFGYA